MPDRLAELEQELRALETHTAALEAECETTPVMATGEVLVGVRRRVEYAVADAAPGLLKRLPGTVVEPGRVSGMHPAVLRRAHGSSASWFAEADGYAYEPRHPVGKSLGHHTGVGTGELGHVALGPLDGEVIDDAASPDDSMDR